jgi:anti-anti-sigma factor
MLLKFWGVRGSIPAPASPVSVRDKITSILHRAGRQGIDLSNIQDIENFLSALPQDVTSTIGGNTTCLTIETEEGLIIFDAGSGLRELGAYLMEREFGQGRGHATIFFTHTHWDHIQGFPFFQPIYIPGNQFDIYHVHPYVPDVLRRQMTFQVYPALYEDLPSEMRFHRLAEEEVTVAGVRITNIELQHPGSAYAYRIESEHATIVLATDGEYKQLDAPYTHRYIKFYSKADVLIFDAQFSVRESIIKEDWGHSSALIGADIGREAQAKRLVLFHHDPASTDEEIMKVLEETKEYLLAQGHHGYPMEVLVAQEKMEIDLRPELEFDIEESIVEDTIYLTLNGRFGARATQEFRQYLEQRLENYKTDKVILNMRNLDELTVAGIRALLDVRKNAFSMAIVDVPDKIYRVLELSGTTDFFAIYDSEESAVQALSRSNGNPLTKRIR